MTDRCQCADCPGARGGVHVVGGKMVCSGCYARDGHIDFGLIGGSWWDRHPRIRWPVAIAFLIYMAGGTICFMMAVMK